MTIALLVALAGLLAGAVAALVGELRRRGWKAAFELRGERARLLARDRDALRLELRELEGELLDTRRRYEAVLATYRQELDHAHATCSDPAAALATLRQLHRLLPVDSEAVTPPRGVPALRGKPSSSAAAADRVRPPVAAGPPKR